MDQPVASAKCRNVSEEKRARGQRIDQRMRDIRISARRFYEITQISRRTLQRAIEGEDSVKESTYDHIETWLDRLEKRSASFEGIPDEPSESDEPRLVTYRIKGDFGVEVVVEGPVQDRAELEASAMRLMRELRAERGETPESGGQ